MESYLAALIPRLIARGHSVAGWFETAAPGNPPGGMAAPAPSWIEPVADARTTAELRAWQPDLMFVNGLRSPASERVLQTVAPGVFVAHSYYGTCISGTKTHRFPTTRACSREFGPACLAAYYPCRCGGISPMTMVREYRTQSARLALLRDYRRIVVGSTHMRDEYARHGLGGKIRLVPLPTRLPGAPRQRGSEQPSRLLYLGRLEEQKGPDIALEAAAIAARSLDRRLHLQISGEGSLRERVLRRSRELMAREPNLQVLVTEWLSDDAVIAAIDSTDLLLMPSTWPEPFGLVGLEAAARGVPAVAFASGGISDWLSDGISGRLVDPAGSSRVQRFAEGIISVLGDPQVFARMSAACYASAARFSLETHVDELEHVLEDAVHSTARL